MVTLCYNAVSVTTLLRICMCKTIQPRYSTMNTFLGAHHAITTLTTSDEKLVCIKKVLQPP